MSAEGSGMREYRQGDTIRLTATVQDPHGVQVVYATATRAEHRPITEIEEEPVAPLQTKTNSIRLEGVPSQRGAEPETLELQATVDTQAPGVYLCREIQAFDMLNNGSYRPLHPPRQFRIIQSPEDDREGPEVLDVGEFS